MFKIWAKTYAEDKLTRNYLYEGEGTYDHARFRDYAYEICNALDVPSPLILSVHCSHFERFNFCKFMSSDFVETVDFERMTFEYVAKPDKKRCVDLRLYP